MPPPDSRLWRRIALFLAASAALTVSCRRNSDPGDVDRISAECLAQEWPPADGGLTWSQTPVPAISPAQSVGWEVLFDDPECGALAPAPIPSRFDWSGPPSAQYAPRCDPAIVDGKGDFSVSFWSDLASNGNPG